VHLVFEAGLYINISDYLCKSLPLNCFFTQPESFDSSNYYILKLRILDSLYDAMYVSGGLTTNFSDSIVAIFKTDGKNIPKNDLRFVNA